MVFPEAFMALVGDLPQIPRDLKSFDADRTKKLLSLAQKLLEGLPVESTARSVEYLMRITRRDIPLDPVPPLDWVCQHNPAEFDELCRLDPARLKPITRLVPQMRFVARLQRRRV